MTKQQSLPDIASQASQANHACHPVTPEALSILLEMLKQHEVSQRSIEAFFLRGANTKLNIVKLRKSVPDDRNTLAAAYLSHVRLVTSSACCTAHGGGSGILSGLLRREFGCRGLVELRWLWYQTMHRLLPEKLLAYMTW